LAEVSHAAFRAFADGTRRVIVEELADRAEQTMYELCVRLVMKHGIDMTRQAVSKHLAVLEDAGIVKTRQKGKFRMIKFSGRAHLQAVQDWLDKTRRK
jgi:DNA-binding transcriptional ArsR family regulator